MLCLAVSWLMEMISAIDFERCTVYSCCLVLTMSSLVNLA
jgi:hypothetical protein